MDGGRAASDPAQTRQTIQRAPNIGNSRTSCHPITDSVFFIDRIFYLITGNPAPLVRDVMYSPNSTALVVVISVLVPLSSVFVALRFKARKSMKAGLGLDDYTILAVQVIPCDSQT